MVAMTAVLALTVSVAALGVAVATERNFSEGAAVLAFSTLSFVVFLCVGTWTSAPRISGDARPYADRAARERPTRSDRRQTTAATGGMAKRGRADRGAGRGTRPISRLPKYVRRQDETRSSKPRHLPSPRESAAVSAGAQLPPGRRLLRVQAAPAPAALAVTGTVRYQDATTAACEGLVQSAAVSEPTVPSLTVARETPAPAEQRLQEVVVPEVSSDTGTASHADDPVVHTAGAQGEGAGVSESTEGQWRVRDLHVDIPTSAAPATKASTAAAAADVPATPATAKLAVTDEPAQRNDAVVHSKKEDANDASTEGTIDAECGLPSLSSELPTTLLSPTAHQETPPKVREAVKRAIKSNHSTRWAAILGAFYSPPRMPLSGLINEVMAIDKFAKKQTLKRLVASYRRVKKLMEASFNDFARACFKCQPIVVHIGAHHVPARDEHGRITNGPPSFVMKDGLVDREVLLKALRYSSRLKLVILSVCESWHIADYIARELGNVHVIFFTTIVSDRKAAAFISQFYRYMTGVLTAVADSRGSEGPNLEQFFRNAVTGAIRDHGFAVGNPRWWIDQYHRDASVTEAHKQAPDSECFGCYPPVHGEMAIQNGAYMLKSRYLDPGVKTRAAEARRRTRASGRSKVQAPAAGGAGGPSGAGSSDGVSHSTSSASDATSGFDGDETSPSSADLEFRLPASKADVIAPRATEEADGEEERDGERPRGWGSVADDEDAFSLTSTQTGSTAASLESPATKRSGSSLRRDSRGSTLTVGVPVASSQHDGSTAPHVPTAGSVTSPRGTVSVTSPTGTGSVTSQASTVAPASGTPPKAVKGTGRRAAAGKGASRAKAGARAARAAP